MSGVQVFENQYINGEWVASTNAGKFLDVTDSNTAQVVAKVPDGSSDDMNKAVASARAAFEGWWQTPLEERKAKIGQVLANWQKKKPAAIEWFQKELGCTKTFATQVQANMVDLHLGVSTKVVDTIKF